MALKVPAMSLKARSANAEPMFGKRKFKFSSTVALIGLTIQNAIKEKERFNFRLLIFVTV